MRELLCVRVREASDLTSVSGLVSNPIFRLVCAVGFIKDYSGFTKVEDCDLVLGFVAGFVQFCSCLD